MRFHPPARRSLALRSGPTSRLACAGGLSIYPAITTLWHPTMRGTRVTRNWAEVIPRSSLGFRDVTIRDRDELRHFDCVTANPTPSAHEITEIIRDAQWRTWPGFYTCLQFGTADSIVGYAVQAFEPYWHPLHTSDDEEPYLNITVLGIQREFQGERDPRSPDQERYAAVILRGIETLIAPTRPTVVGIYGIVREDNPRSVRLLERSGYVRDGAGPFPDGSTDASSIVLRKPRTAWRAR